MVLGQVFCSFAGSDDLEACGAAPVDHFADQCGLVAVRQRVDDTRLARAAREQWAGERVGLDVHHHDMLALRTTGERVADASRGITGGVDDDIDLRGADERGRIVSDMGRTALRCGCKRRHRITLLLPAAARE